MVVTCSTGGTSIITTEVLHHSTNIASNIPRTSPQCRVQVAHAPPQEATVSDLVSKTEDMRLYESTHYIGEGSLLILDDKYNGDMLIPQAQTDLTQVVDSLKILPNHDTVPQLIKLYYKHVHRYFPALKERVVWESLKDLSRPQHLLLLNVIFFTASPFHEDPCMQDGRIYYDRAEALLYEYCTQPHVLTVVAIVILGRHNKQVGSNWMYNGIASKMLIELGLHRKFKDPIKRMSKREEQLRNEAFWATFTSENFASATYGRPNMIDETDCDIDVPTIPPGNQLERIRPEVAFIHLINLSRICSGVRKYIHAASRKNFLVCEDENKFRILDAALGNWFHNLPDWLKFEEMIKDPNGTLMNGIGGDMHLLFYTVLILLHSRYLNSSGPYLDATSPTVCMRSAIIIVHWLEILLDNHKDFFALAVSGSFAIKPAMRVFSWHARYDMEEIETENGYRFVKSENCKKAEEMNTRLRSLEFQISEISQRYDRGRSREEKFGLTEWLGIPTHPHNRLGNDAMKVREWEVFVADDDQLLRKQYSRIARKQSSGFFPSKRKSLSYNAKGIRSHPGSRYDFFGSSTFGEPDDLNFTFKADKYVQFSAFQQQP